MKKRHNSTPLFILGGAALAAMAGVLAFKGGGLPAFMMPASQAPAENPNTWTPVQGGTTASNGPIGTGVAAGSRYGLGYAPYTSTGGGLIVTPGAGTLTPTLATDPSSTRGGAGTSTGFSVGGYYR